MQNIKDKVIGFAVGAGMVATGAVAMMPAQAQETYTLPTIIATGTSPANIPVTITTPDTKSVKMSINQIKQRIIFDNAQEILYTNEKAKMQALLLKITPVVDTAIIPSALDSQ